MLNEWLRKKLPDEYCEHAAAGVSVFFHGEYETGCAGNCGGAGTRPVTADDLFNLGSLSKVYCAAIIMKLHEEGLIDLDAPVCRYLPEFAVRRGRYGKITVRMLLNHSSGMSGTMYRGAMLDREHRPDDAGFLRWLSQNSLKAEPGAYSVYCNDGFQLAGMLAARAGSATEQELLAKWITEPIGAVTTRFGRSDPEGTEQIRAEGCRAEYPMAGGAGGIVSRVGDLARFGAQFLDGGYILSRESVQEMIAPQGRTFLQNDGYSSGFGLGWDFTDYRPWGMDFGKGTVGKSGSTFQFSSFLLVSREHDFCAAVSGLSYSGFSAARLTAELAAEMLPATKSIRQTTPPDKTPGGEICGYYSGDGGLFRIRKTAEGFLRADYRSGGFENEASTRAYFESNLCCGSEELGFEEYQGKFFAYKSKYGVRFPFAQQLVPGASVPDGWKARTGRHYIACNRSFCDQAVGFLWDVMRVDVLSELGVVLFCWLEPDGETVMPALADGGDATRMLLNCPGQGARDTFAPYVIDIGGREAIFDRGYLFVDAETLPLYRSGPEESFPDSLNGVYRVNSHNDLPDLERREGTRRIILDSGFHCVFDDTASAKIPHFRDGYLLILNDTPDYNSMEEQR